MRTMKRMRGIGRVVTATVIVPLIVGVGGAAVRKKAGDVGFQLLEEPTNPAAIGMGAAATARGGAGFAYYNPALPFLAGKRYLALEYGQYPAGDLQRGHVESSWLFERLFIAASFHSESIKDIFRATADGKVSRDHPFSAQLSAAALDVGYIWYDRIAAGISFGGVQDRIGTSDAFGWALSFGGAFKVIPGKLDVGMALVNPQVEIEREDEDPLRVLWGSTGYLDTTREWGDGPRMPMTLRAGASWTDSIRSLPYSVAMDLVYRRVDGRVMVPVGLEVRPVAPLAVRMGKRFGHDTEALNLGVGLSLAPVAFDMSFTIPKLVDDAELKWLVAIRYSLEGTRDTKDTREKAKPPSAPKTDSAAAPGIEVEAQSGADTTAPIIVEEIVPVSDTVSRADDGTDAAATDTDSLTADSSAETPSDTTDSDTATTSSSMTTGGDKGGAASPDSATVEGDAVPDAGTPSANGDAVPDDAPAALDTVPAAVEETAADTVLAPAAAKSGPASETVEADSLTTGGHETPAAVDTLDEPAR